MPNRAVPAARVLIAHQSSIPHYRVPFYAALEAQRPADWGFEVVFDHSELTRPRFFAESLDPADLTFPLRDTRTTCVRVRGRRISYQHFWRAASGYDVVVVEHAFNNLAYPLSQLHQLRGVRVAYWGPGRDMGTSDVGRLKGAAEAAKLRLARSADGYFAYTEGVRGFLIDGGLRPDRVWALGNTIDIAAQRRIFERARLERDASRRELGVEGRKVLLFVGRFKAYKKIDLLMEAFAELRRRDPEVHLLLVGDGGQRFVDAWPSDAVTYLGIRLGEALARIYVASDLFVCPGAVGLGPLQAQCYDLPTVTIDRPTHGSEFEYLTPQNSIVLPEGTGATGFADAVADLLAQPSRLAELQAGSWPSIAHLTVDRMAQNFIAGINELLRA